MITSSNIVEFFELYLRPFLEQERDVYKRQACILLFTTVGWNS